MILRCSISIVYSNLVSKQNVEFIVCIVVIKSNALGTLLLSEKQCFDDCRKLS